MLLERDNETHGMSGDSCNECVCVRVIAGIASAGAWQSVMTVDGAMNANETKQRPPSVRSSPAARTQVVRQQSRLSSPWNV